MFKLEAFASAVVVISVGVAFVAIRMNFRGQRSTASTRLAAQLVRKKEHDDFWQSGNKQSVWYDVDFSTIPDDDQKIEAIREKFLLSSQDEATSKFIDQSVDLSDSWLLQVRKAVQRNQNADADDSTLFFFFSSDLAQSSPFCHESIFQQNRHQRIPQ